MQDIASERRRRRPLPLVVPMVVGAWLLVAGDAFAATPIANGSPTSLPSYSGAAASRNQIRARRPPHNPSMARNGRNNVHNDAWMSDTYWIRGPLGRSPETLSTAIGRVCVTVTFDRKGRLVATCSALTGAHLFMFDPVTLDTLAEFALPFVAPPAGQDPTTNSAGGAYFYLDDKDRAVVATADGHIWIVAETGSGATPGFALERDFDLSSVIGDDRVTSVLPDWKGKLWFVGRYHGIVGVLDPDTGDVRTIQLGEEIENSFAVDRHGVYIVSDVSMYRFDLDATGTPTVTWSQAYQNSGVTKTGQFNAGSGTTPTLLDGGYVAITDNADPMNVVVYRRAATLPPGQSRTVCEVPVFAAGASATENSLIGVGKSLIVENNYGYYVVTTMNGAVTSPGVIRIDIDSGGCHVVWENTTERVPSVVSKVSARTGLLYTFTKDPDPANPSADVWFWAALDFETGELVWKQLAGTGLGFNNHYAGIALGRDGTAYVGAIGGLLAIRDTK
jgi:hypothetical protein